jgi:putative addiction module antidote
VTKLKVRKIGNSIGVIFPKEMAADLSVVEGDELSASKTQNGYELSAYDPAFEEAMDAGRKIMRRYRNTLRELAK